MSPESDFTYSAGTKRAITMNDVPRKDSSQPDARADLPPAQVLSYATPKKSPPGGGPVNAGHREAMGVVLLMFGGPLFLAGIGEWIHSLIGDWPAWSKRNEMIQAVVLPTLGMVMIIAGFRWMRRQK